MKMRKIELRLLEGAKTATVRTSWAIMGTPYEIHRYQSGNVNSSSALKKPHWFVRTLRGETIVIPARVRRHEVSIAKWLLQGGAQ